ATATCDLAAHGESRCTENGLWVSGGFCNTLGVTAALGRVFNPSDDVRGCGSPGVVLSHEFWRREFGGLPSALGARIRVDGRPLEILGVTAAGFRGVEVGRSFDLALPLCADQVLNGTAHRLDARAAWWL